MTRCYDVLSRARGIPDSHAAGGWRGISPAEANGAGIPARFDGYFRFMSLEELKERAIAFDRAVETYRGSLLGLWLRKKHAQQAHDLENAAFYAQVEPWGA